MGRLLPGDRPWRRAWEHVVPLFAFPPAIRKMIYTTGAVLRPPYRWVESGPACAHLRSEPNLPEFEALPVDVGAAARQAIAQLRVPSSRGCPAFRFA
jgi:hypothetical protein